MKAIAVLVPIFTLLFVGLWIALKSAGLSFRSPGRLKNAMTAVSSIFMELVALLILLLGLQSIAGVPIQLLIGE